MALERHFMLVTLSLVVILGVPAALSLLSVPQKFDSELSTKNSRKPSSVNLVQDSAGISSLGSSISKDVGCEPELDLGPTESAHLRLKTGPCGEYSNIQILNQTNGFTAENMETKPGHSTSDFIDLSEGENRIKISRQSPDGAKTIQMVRVSRVPASKVE